MTEDIVFKPTSRSVLRVMADIDADEVMVRDVADKSRFGYDAVSRATRWLGEYGYIEREGSSGRRKLSINDTGQAIAEALELIDEKIRDQPVGAQQTITDAQANDT